MNISCSAEPCPVILDCSCVFYSGANLIYTGIVTNDTLCAALTKIDNKFKDAAIGYVFQNGIIQAVPGGPVKLGGTLNQNTVITSAGYTLALTGTIESSAFITTGGTISQFVKGDGSLDGTSYQPAGNYITALTGDGTATGPGSAPFTLSTTGVLANTYGSSTDIPIITVDTKGRITLATSVPFVAPPALLIFSGDVTGAGYTNTTIPLTLAPVLSTPGTYGSTTSIPVVTVNAKGLVTNISQVSFTAGTVTSVGVSAGTGISASVANPTTTPVITITNTAPDQIVALTPGTGIGITGTYPSFTITNTGTTSVPTLQQVTGVGNDTTFSITSFSTQGFQVKTPVNQVLASLQSNVGQTEGEVFISDTFANSTIYKRTGILAGTNTLTFPNATGTFALSVNGNTADSTGAITIPVGTGTVTAVTATSPITSSGGTAPDISTSMATNKLIGRSSAGTGIMEEITVGTGLFLSGGTLSATAAGILHGTASGTDTYTVTIAGATAYADGDAYLIRFPNGNTTGATIDISGFGAVVLYRNNDGPIIGGDIWNGAEMLCIYNSTTAGFQLIGTSPNAMYAYITNDDSVTITKGQVVYAFGGTGDRMTVKLANNTGDATSAQTVGVVLSTSIAANQKGVIITQGLLDGLSILPTATYNDGDPLYLGATAGSITNVKPYAPNHLVYLGNVTTASNGAAGRWYVRVQNGYELDELHNVQARTPALKDTLWYDNTVSPAQWKTASISTILGYTPQAALTLTTTGTSGAATLIANTLNIPQYAGATPGGVSGNIQYNDGTTFAGSNNLFWDNTNIRLGVAQSTPTSRFHLNFNQNSVTQSDANGILLANSTAAIAGTQSISPALVWQGNGWKTTATAASQDVRFRADVLPVQGTTNPNASWRLSTSVNGGAYVNRMTVTTTGAAANFTTLDIDSSNQGQIRSGSIYAASRLVAVDQVEGGGTIPSGTNAYKTTNAGASIVPKIGSYSTNTTGTKYISLDNTNSFVLGAFNSSGTIIARAGIDITNLSNTAGSESGDLIFSTQSGGTAISEKMRIFAAGNVGIGTGSTNGGFKLDVNGTTRLNGNLTTNITTTQIAYSSSGVLSGSANLYWDNTNNYLVNRGYYFFEYDLFSGCGLVGRRQGTSTLLFQMGFNAQAQYGGTIGAVSGSQFFVYNFQEALGGANSYYWGFDNTGDNYWGSSNTAYSVRVQQPRAANIPLAIQGQTSQTGRLLTITTTSAGTVGDVMSVFPAGNVTIGNAVDQGLKLYVGGTVGFSSTLSIGTSAAVGSQLQLAGTSTVTNAFSRLISGGAATTPYLAAGNLGSTAGNTAITIDPTYQLSFMSLNSGGFRTLRGSIRVTNLNNTAGSDAGDMIFLTQTGGTAMSEKMRITGAGGLTINATNTATGTTGNQTINKASGTVNIAAAGTTVTVTNSLVTASSIVYAVIRTNDATATIKNVVPAAGSFVINLNAATTAETSIGFFVIN